MTSSINPHSAQALTTRIPCTIGGHDEHVAWTYAANQPYSVEISIPTPDGVTVIWEFARNLLADLTRPAGIGDVQFAPIDERTTALVLESPDGKAELRFGTEDIRQFRNKSYVVCLPEHEPAPDVSSVENVLRAAAENVGGDW